MKVFFPYCNPIQFKKEGVYENYLDAQVFEESNAFLQPFCEDDRIQFIVNWSDIEIFTHNIRIDVIVNGVRVTYKEHNVLVYGFGGDYYTSYFNQQLQSRTSASGYYIFSNLIKDIKVNNTCLIQNCDEFQFVVNIFGVDYFSNTITLISDISETKLLQYGSVSSSRTKQSEYVQFDTLFSALFEPFEIRLPATFLQPKYKTNKEIFMSYSMNIELVSAIPFENIVLEIGKSIGIPDWFIRSLNFIFHCRGKKIDGVEYELTADSNLDSEIIEGYNLRYLKVELAPTKNKYSFVNEVASVLPILSEITLSRLGKIMTGSITISGLGEWYFDDNKSGTLLSISLSQIKGLNESEVTITSPLNKTGIDTEYTLVFKTKDSEIEIKVIVPPIKSGIGFGKIGETFYIG